MEVVHGQDHAGEPVFPPQSAAEDPMQEGDEVSLSSGPVPAIRLDEEDHVERSH